MGKRMPGRLSFVKIFSACGSIIYRRKRRKTDMNAKMIIGICLVVFIVAGLIVLRLKNRK